MRLMRVILVLVALLVLAGCGQQTPAPVDNGTPQVGGKLDGVHWVLVAMGDEGVVPEAMQAWIEFSTDGQVNGNGGCNSFFGGYEASDDGSLSFGMIGMTEMWCEETGDLEASFHEYLLSVTTYVVYENRLSMFDANDDAVLVFEPGEAVSASETDSAPNDDVALGGELTDIRWLLTGMSDMELQFSDVSIDITFGADNQANGNSGCNDFFGGYLYTPDGELSFGPLAMTRKLCADTDSFEQEFHTLIAEVTSYAVDGNKLYLYNADGLDVLRFEMDPNTTVSNTPETELGGELAGIHWDLISILGVDSLPEVMEAWIEFNDGEVSGNGGCNSFFGSYELLAEGELSFGMLGMTEMWCEETGDLEVTFHEHLQSVTGYLLRDDTLILTNADGDGVLIFEFGEMRSDLGDEGIILGGDLSGIKWLLVDMGLETKVHLADDIEAWIEFGDDGQVAGVSACNNFFGPYESESKGHLVFGVLGMTRKMCMDTDAIETEFHQLLSTVTMYAVDSEQLLLLNAQGDTIMRFEMAPDTPVSSEAGDQAIGELTGRNWIWTANSDDDSDPMFNWGRLSISFSDNGEVTGYSGCNGYSGTYERDGEGNLALGPMVMTMMFCEDTAEQETSYHQALATVTRYTVEGDALRLFDANNEVVLRYRQDPIDASETFTREMLDSGTYPNEFAADGMATLHHGVYREPIGDGASQIYVMLMNTMAFGDLNGDGNERAAVIFVTSSGGTGSFYTLAVVDVDGDTVLATQPVNLGDRIQVQGLRIEGADIVIDMVRHGPDDPMCCPTEQATVRYTLQDGQLIEVADM